MVRIMKVAVIWSFVASKAPLPESRTHFSQCWERSNTVVDYKKHPNFRDVKNVVIQRFAFRDNETELCGAATVHCAPRWVTSLSPHHDTAAQTEQVAAHLKVKNQGRPSGSVSKLLTSWSARPARVFFNFHYDFFDPWISHNYVLKLPKYGLLAIIFFKLV